MLFVLVISSLGEEGAGLCVSRASVFFFCFFFCTCCFFIFHFSLRLGVGGWLRFVIVALPGLLY